jgi:diacylglycerol kinase (ATP)
VTNKPKYHILSNTQYALAGLRAAFRDETSFKIELALFVIAQIAIFASPIELVYKLILAISAFLPLFAELINSAIERVVDLVTLERHPLAKAAKDIGSSVVFVSIVMTVAIWSSVFYFLFFDN